jgi:hypothetical protein
LLLRRQANAKAQMDRADELAVPAADCEPSAE